MSDSPTSNIQSRNIMKTVWVLLAVMAFFIGALVIKLQRPVPLGEVEQQQLQLVLFDQPRIIDDFQLTQHHNQPFSLDHLRGQWSMVFPGFTYCPDICPTTLSILAQAYQGLQENSTQGLPQIIMLSVDPNRDTVEKLNQYVPYFDNNFLGLTGELSDIMKVAMQMNIAFTPVASNTIDDSYQVDHSGNIVLIDPEGYYRGFIKPPFTSAQIQTIYQRVAQL